MLVMTSVRSNNTQDNLYIDRLHFQSQLSFVRCWNNILSRVRVSFVLLWSR